MALAPVKVSIYLSGSTYTQTVQSLLIVTKIQVYDINCPKKCEFKVGFAQKSYTFGGIKKEKNHIDYSKDGKYIFDIFTIKVFSPCK